MQTYIHTYLTDTTHTHTHTHTHAHTHTRTHIHTPPFLIVRGRIKGAGVKFQKMLNSHEQKMLQLNFTVPLR